MSTPQRKFWQRQSVKRLSPAIERRTHIALADLLRVAVRPGWWWSHIPSGEYRTPETGALLKRMGLQPGMLDFLIIAPSGEHYWLELKRGNAPLTPEQLEFIRMLDLRNVFHYVARSYDDAVQQLKIWGVL